MTEENTYVKDKIETIEATELLIDPNRELYLITWVPDPRLLPDCHFEYQHRYNIEILAKYCKCCWIAIFCVEATQLGNPHYHGFYQVDPYLEEVRILTIKTLQKLGLVKITKAKKWKINKYTERGNALYYYKKELFYNMIHIVDNPITHSDECGINWGMTHYFDSTVSQKHISNVVSERQRLLEFYKDSTI